MNYGFIRRFSLCSYIFALILVLSQPSWSLSPSLEELFKIAQTSLKFKNVSREGFTVLLKTKRISEFSMLLRQLPHEERISALLEVAAEKNLIKQTEIPAFYSNLARKGDGETP